MRGNCIKINIFLVIFKMILTKNLNFYLILNLETKQEL